VPERVVKLDHRPWTGTATNTSVIHQDVDRAEGIKDLLNHSRRNGNVRKICWYGQGFATALPNLVYQRLQGDRASGCDSDRGTLTPEANRDCATDTAAGPRDQSNAAF
jgi:hypothetical protein